MNAPIVSVLRPAKANALPGETVWDAAERCLVYEAIMQEGDGKRAAKLLGISPRVFCYKRRRLGFGQGQEHELKPKNHGGTA